MSTPLHWAGVVKAIGADEIVIDIGGGTEPYPEVGTELHIFVKKPDEAVPAFEPAPQPKPRFEAIDVTVIMQKLPVRLRVELGQMPTPDIIKTLTSYCKNVLHMGGLRVVPGGTGKTFVEISGRMSPMIDTGPLTSSMRYVLNGGSMTHEHDHG